LEEAVALARPPKTGSRRTVRQIPDRILLRFDRLAEAVQSAQLILHRSIAGCAPPAARPALRRNVAADHIAGAVDEDISSCAELEGISHGVRVVVGALQNQRLPIAHEDH